jgi:anti-anti-sigma regulatory factor/anti-sigma regulatory factor (Ser/Thr protein kinase)
VFCESAPEVDLQHRGQVAGPDEGQQHRDRWSLEARLVPAWGIVTPELGAQVDQQPGPGTQQPITAELPLGPDRPDDLLVDHALDGEPGQRPDHLTLAALPPDSLAGQLQPGAMADRAGGGDRFLLAALQEHVLAGQGRRVGEGRGQVDALGGLLDAQGHRHHQVIVVPRLLRRGYGTILVGGSPGRTAGHHRGWAMEIQHSMRDGCVIVAFTGSIDLFSVSQIHHALLKDLSEKPYALICDLSAVQHLDPVCATVFSTVANHPSSRWPTTSFLLCGAQPPVAEILGRLRMPSFLPLYATLEEALDAAVDRPPYLRDELLLAPTPTAAAASRVFVRDILDYWQPALPDGAVLEQAVQVANELVTNAVVHARTDLRLRLELRGDWLHIAVRDGSPRLLRRVTANPEAEGGRGLWLVEQLARAWGVHPHPDGGKVVWCTLKLYNP